MAPIRLVLADVDGTLVTPDKALTPRAVAAVAALRLAGVRFAVTSGRPPLGMAMLVEPLGLETPIGAFDGGVIVDPAMTLLAEQLLAADLVGDVAGCLAGFGLDVWIYQGSDWYVQDPSAPHVAREAQTVRYAPKVMRRLERHTDKVAKIVGVGDDPAAMAAASTTVRARFAGRLNAAASQPYYLDVTHPGASKAYVLDFLATRYGLADEEIATIGDMPTDVRMFARSGLAIAMGNAGEPVKAAAGEVTATNGEDGFAKAMERFVLGR